MSILLAKGAGNLNAWLIGTGPLMRLPVFRSWLMYSEPLNMCNRPLYLIRESCRAQSHPFANHIPRELAKSFVMLRGATSIRPEAGPMFRRAYCDSLKM